MKVNGKTTYLDSASTTQTPPAVLDAMNKYYTNYRANIHRGVYDSSIQATEAYEASRASLAQFINAKPKEIIFTSGSTASLNQLAYSLSPRLSHRDNIVLTRMEHHANLVPWQQMAKHYGFEIRFIDEKNSADDVIDENTKIVSVTYVSNVLGVINPIKEIVKTARRKAPRAYTIVDAAQAVAHLPVDVRKLDCDFLAFSGHKMYGPTGIGVLYGKETLLEEHLEPFMFGGEMVKAVTFEKSTWNDVPWKFEAGTPNIAGAIGLGAAVKYIQKLGWKKIIAHENKLTGTLIKELKNLGSEIVGPEKTKNRIGVVSFTLPGIHPHDIADILNRYGVCVRAGFHCAEPLLTYLGRTQGAVRASVSMLNTEADIRKLIRALKKSRDIFS